MASDRGLGVRRAASREVEVTPAYDHSASSGIRDPSAEESSLSRPQILPMVVTKERSACGKRQAL